MNTFTQIRTYLVEGRPNNNDNISNVRNDATTNDSDDLLSFDSKYLEMA